MPHLFRDARLLCIFLPIFTGCMLCGCAGGPVPDSAAWPWERAKETANNQTGEYITFRGNVAKFGKPDKAMKPVEPDTLKPVSSRAEGSSGVPKTQLPPASAEGETDRRKIEGKVRTDYDFTVRTEKVAPPSYLPQDTVRTSHDIIASNRGDSPVSVSIGMDPSSQNIATDQALPYYAVVPPHSELPLVQVRPKDKTQSYNFSYSFSWALGDYTATHASPEHYRFPFSKSVKAFAEVSGEGNSSPFTRHSVIFSMPVETPVLAARKGKVIRVTSDKVDLLHDDRTIATYSHLDRVADSIVVGKDVSAEENVGVAGMTYDKKEAYFQLTVWRPEQPRVATQKNLSEPSGFDSVSFPIDFCFTESGDCKVLVKDQVVWRGKRPGAKKLGRRK